MVLYFFFFFTIKLILKVGKIVPLGQKVIKLCIVTCVTNYSLSLLSKHNCLETQLSVLLVIFQRFKSSLVLLVISLVKIDVALKANDFSLHIFLLLYTDIVELVLTKWLGVKLFPYNT